MNKQKHLTLDSRITIETMLNKGESFKAIGRFYARIALPSPRKYRITSALKKAGLMAGHSMTAVWPFCINALHRWFVRNVPFAKGGSAGPAANAPLPVSSTKNIPAPGCPTPLMSAMAARNAINVLWKNISIRLLMLKRSMNWSERKPELALPFLKANSDRSTTSFHRF